MKDPEKFTYDDKMLKAALDELEAEGRIVWTGEMRLDPDGVLRKCYVAAENLTKQ
jgi:hypothetical protein